MQKLLDAMRAVRHFAAASQVRTLFEEAVRATDQVVDDHGKRKKSEALHFYTPFRTKINGEEKYVVADISVITYQASDSRLIHCLALTLEAPDDSRGRPLKRQSPSPRVE